VNVRNKTFRGGTILLPDDVPDSAAEIDSLRFMLDDPEATIPDDKKKRRGTVVQNDVDLLLNPQIIGKGEKAFRMREGRLEYDIVLSGTNTDRDGEVVVQSTLAELWEVYRRNPVVMYMHSWMDVVGSVTEFWQDSPSTSGPQQSYGTMLLGKDFHFVQPFGVKMHMDDLVAKIVQEILRSASIAFNAKRIVPEEGAPQLELNDWFETSMVTIPSYRSAQIVHRMFEAFRGRGTLPPGYARLLYTGEEGTSTTYDGANPKNITATNTPPKMAGESWSEENDDELRGIVQQLDVDFAAHTPAPQGAEADSKALAAVLGDIVTAGRMD
jgi:hypothetical protein